MTETELMLTHLLKCRRVDLFTQSLTLTISQQKELEEMQTRRRLGEPLQYILGTCDFMGSVLKLDERVLIPRPETELLAEIAIGYLRRMNKTGRVLDLGTGCGNIAITLAKNIPDLHVTAVEISPGAMALAKTNARESGVAHRITFVENDMKIYLKDIASQQTKFDMIIANPPYIPSAQVEKLPEVVRREPRLALDGGRDGLEFYRAIFGWGGPGLKQGGVIMVEIGDGQGPAVREIVERISSFRQVETFNDYIGTERILFATLYKLTRNMIEFKGRSKMEEGR